MGKSKSQSVAPNRRKRSLAMGVLDDSIEPPVNDGQSPTLPPQSGSYAPIL